MRSLAVLTWMAAASLMTGGIAAAQPASVHGRVMGQDEQGQHLGPVQGATVEFVGAGKATTDAAGYYEIRDIQPGEFRYKVTAKDFRDEDAGRGFQLTASGAHVLDFVLTKGANKPTKPANPGELTGTVWKETSDGKNPLPGAVVAIKSNMGGPALLVTTGSDGSYRTELAPGTWQASASTAGFAPSHAPGPIEIEDGAKAKLDFTFTLKTETTVKKTAEVYALVSVQLAESDKQPSQPPTVEFVATDGAKLPAKVRTLAGKELADLGLTPQSATGDAWAWFFAQTEQPLAPGAYRAQASLTEYKADETDTKPITADATTYFDLALRPLKDMPPAPQPPQKVTHAQPPCVHGRVMGQDEKGNHLGPIAGAKVQFQNAAGKTLAETTTEAGGYYRIDPLAQGQYAFEVTADGYRAEDAGRSFVLAAEGAHVLDFVLTKGTSEPHDPAKRGTLSGRVWKETNGQREPMPDAVVAVVPDSGGQLRTRPTGPQGRYSFNLSPGKYRASATIAGFPTRVHPSVVEVAAEGEATVDFTFTVSDDSQQQRSHEVYALVAVQLAQTDKPGGRQPEVKFVPTVGNDTATPTAATLRALTPKELAEQGLSSEITSDGYWKWYVGQAATPLLPGTYRVDAGLSEYKPGTSETKAVAVGTTTWFDVALRPIKPISPTSEHCPPPQLARCAPSLHGRVMGQDEKGQHLGPVAGAKVDLTDSSGAPAGSAVTDEFGYYQIKPLWRGEFQYRLVAESYQEEKAGRGLQLAAEGAHVLDFVVTKGSKKPQDPETPSPQPQQPSQLVGNCYLDEGQGPKPLAAAQIALRPLAGGPGMVLAANHPDGSYRAVLPPGKWQVAAMTPGLAPTPPTGVDLVAGQSTRQDFIFTRSTSPTPDPHSPSAPVLVAVAVERCPSAGTSHDLTLPQVRFICGDAHDSGDDSQAIDDAVLVQPLSSVAGGAQQLAAYGISTGASSEGWDWFLASPSSPLEPGRYAAEAREEGYLVATSATRVVHPAITTVYELRLTRVRPQVTVIVQSKDKSPVEGMDVKFINKDLGRRLADATACKTDAKGQNTVTLDDGVGNYNVLVTGKGYQPQAKEFLIATEKQTLTFQVFKEGEVRTTDLAITVMKRKSANSTPDEPNVPAEGAKLTLRPVSGAPLPASMKMPLVANSQGHIAVEKLPEGDFSVSIDAPGCSAYADQLTAKVDMKPVTYVLTPRNEELENALKALLTEGWGKTPQAIAASKRHYDRAVKADPHSCRPDYACALTRLSAGDLSGAKDMLHGAITKKQDDFIWDRGCEARIWIGMFRRESASAAQELEALAKRHYADRTPNHASEETSYVMGICAGVFKGPWKKSTPGVKGDKLEEAILAALTSPHREEFQRGCAEVSGQLDSFEKAIDDAEGQMQAAADAARDAELAKINKRLEEIDKELAVLPMQAQAARDEGTKRVAELERQNAPIVAQRRTLLTLATPLIAKRDQILACLAQDRVRYQSYQAPSPSPSSDHPSDQGASASAQQILEEIREHERDLLVIGREISVLDVQDRQLAASSAALEAEYNRENAVFNTTIARLEGTQRNLLREQELLKQRQKNPGAAVPRKPREVTDLEHSMTSFSTYRTFPLERRRQELLDLISGNPISTAPTSISPPITPPAPGGTTPQSKPAPAPSPTQSPTSTSAPAGKTPAMPAAPGAPATPTSVAPTTKPASVIEALQPELKRRNAQGPVKPIAEQAIDAAYPGHTFVPVPSLPEERPADAPQPENGQPNPGYRDRDIIVVGPDGQQRTLTCHGGIRKFMRETYPAVTNDAQAEAAVRVFICFAKAKYPELTFGEVGNIVTRADEGGRIVRARTPVTAGGSDYLGIRLTFDKDGKLDYVGFHAPKVGTTR